MLLVSPLIPMRTSASLRGCTLWTVPLPWVEGIANDECPAIILESASQNLRGGGTETAGQDNQRSIIENRRVTIIVFFHGVICTP